VRVGSQTIKAVVNTSYCEMTGWTCENSLLKNGCGAIVAAVCGPSDHPLVYEFRDSLVHDPGVRPLLPVPLSSRNATVHPILVRSEPRGSVGRGAISLGVLPPTDKGEIKPSIAVDGRV
jgi:hypothetical protein